MEVKMKTVFKTTVVSLLLGLCIFSALYFGYRTGNVEGLNQWEESGKPVDISAIKDVGRLEVLTTDVSLYLKDIYGKEDGTPLSATLYRKEGVAVYSIDLSKLVIVKDDMQRKMSIAIPETAISVELYVDETSTNLEASFIAHSWTGNANDGYAMAMNLSKSVYDEMMEELQNFDGLLLLAVDSGIKQIERLANAAVKDSKNWDIIVFLKKEL